jgi:hypothetical protein
MKKFLHIIILVFIANLAYAQTGVLKGKVIDRKTKETVIGATVSIVGTYYAVPTDVNGNYTINNIKPGDYSVKIVYLGYKEQLNNGIKITNGNKLSFDFINVNDAARILVAAIESQKTNGILNGASGVEISLSELALIVKRNISESIEIENEDHDNFIFNLFGGGKNLVAKNRRHKRK